MSFMLDMIINTFYLLLLLLIQDKTGISFGIWKAIIGSRYSLGLWCMKDFWQRLGATSGTQQFLLSPSDVRNRFTHNRTHLRFWSRLRTMIGIRFTHNRRQIRLWSRLRTMSTYNMCFSEFMTKYQKLKFYALLQRLGTSEVR